MRTFNPANASNPLSGPLSRALRNCAAPVAKRGTKRDK